MKTILIALLLVSCGKKNNSGGVRQCKSRYTKVTNCIQIHEHNYGTYYAESMCSQRYPVEGCYK